jgi:hypothetical protein
MPGQQANSKRTAFFIEYQPLKDLCINELTEGGALVFVEGFDPAALGR